MVKITYSAIALLGPLLAPTTSGFMTTSQVRMTGVARDAFFRLNSNSSLSGPDNWMGSASEVSEIPTVKRVGKIDEGKVEKPMIDDLLLAKPPPSSIAGKIANIDASPQKAVVQPAKKATSDGVMGAFLWLAIALGGAMVISSPDFSLVDFDQLARLDLSQLELSQFSGLDLSHLPNVELPQVQNFDIKLPQFGSVDWSRFENADFSLPSIENVDIAMPKFEKMDISTVDFGNIDLSSGAALMMAKLNLDKLDISASLAAVGEYHWRNLAWARELGQSMSSSLGLSQGVSPLQAVAQHVQEMRAAVLDSLPQGNLMKDSLSISTIQAQLASQAQNILLQTQQSFGNGISTLQDNFQPDLWAESMKVETERAVVEVSNAVVGMQHGAIRMVGEIQDGIPVFVEAMNEGVQGSMKTATDIGEAIPRLVHDAASTTTSVASQAVADVKNAALRLPQEVAHIREGTRVFGDALRVGVDSFVEGMSMLIQKCIDTVKLFAHDVKSFAVTAGGHFEHMAEDFQSFAGETSSRVKEEIPQVPVYLDSTMTKISDYLAVTAQDTSIQAKEVMTVMQQRASQMQASMTEFSFPQVSDMKNVISDKASDLANSIPQPSLPAMGDLKESMSTKVGEAMGSMTRISVPAFGSILDSVDSGDMMESFKSHAVGIQDSLLQVSTPYVTDFTAAPQVEPVGDVSAAVTQVPSSVTQVLQVERWDDLEALLNSK